MTPAELAGCLEATLLRADATEAEVRSLCAEALKRGLYAVCVAPSRVVLACHLLEDSPVKVVTVAGFPLGFEDVDTKRMAIEGAVDLGVHEIDLVPNLGRLKDGDSAGVLRELRDLVEAADERVVKVILETGLLTREELALGCRLAGEAGAHFVKTNTGFGPRGVTVDDVRFLRQTVGEGMGVKAAGGIRDTAAAMALIEAGANRIGSSVAGLVLGDTTAALAS